MTKRTPVHSLRGREGNQVSVRPGEEYVINRAMHLRDAFGCRRVQKHVYFNGTTSLHKDFVSGELSF